MQAFAGKYLSGFTDSRLEILDIGSQDINGSYKQIFQNSKWRYTGADITPGENVDLVLKNMYDWGNIKSNRYDVIVSGQTFEHIEYFWFTIMEISRILKTGGLCCLIAPSGGDEHKYPVDCWRFYPDGFRSLARYAGLEVCDAAMQRSKELYPDYDPMWQDTILVCRKTRLRPAQRIKLHLKNRLSVFLAIRLNLH